MGFHATSLDLEVCSKSFKLYSLFLKHWSRASSPMPPQDPATSICQEQPIFFKCSTVSGGGRRAQQGHPQVTGGCCGGRWQHESVAAAEVHVSVLQGVPDDDLTPALTYLTAWLPTKLLPNVQLAVLIPS
jgi:hypothetical protein